MSFVLLGILNAQAAGGAAVAPAYDLLETEVLGSGANTFTFSSLSTYSADYQHLQIREVARNTSGSGTRLISMRFNGDTGANYSNHVLGATTSVFRGGDVNNSQMYYGNGNELTTTNLYYSSIIDINDFASTNKYKTMRVLMGSSNDSPSVIWLGSGSWRNLAAIDSVTLFTGNASNYEVGSRWSLYGLRKAS